MLNINTNQPFIAQWTSQNAPLNPCQKEGLAYVIQKVKGIVCFLPNLVVAVAFNPRPADLSNRRGVVNKEVLTPDNVRLKAFVQTVKNATSDTPTVIFFNPLGAREDVHDSLASILGSRNCNVVTFNYRGLGTTRSAKDLVLDGESVYQYVTQELGTKKEHVHFYGFSLGGAVAAQVKALHPDSNGKFVGDRPFKSVFSLITEKCSVEKLGPVVKKITSFIAAIFIAYPLRFLGWEWEGAKALKQMNGEHRIVYHPNDWLVPYNATLASACEGTNTLKLDPSKTGPNTHFASIENHQTANDESAIKKVADFLAK